MRFRKKVHIAPSLLLYRKKRLILSLSGISFAVVIMFMQLGFFNGFNDSQAILPPHLDADLVLMHIKRVHMNKWDNFNTIRLNQALAFDDVAEAVPLYLGTVGMKNTLTDMTKRMFVIAFPPGTHPLKIAGLSEYENSLKVFGNVLFDTNSREIYGPVDVGDRIELNDMDYTVSGLVELGPSFSLDGMLLMSADTWINTVLMGRGDEVSFGLLRLRPGTDIASLKTRLLETLPSDTTVLTPEEIRVREIRYTTRVSPIGAVFGIGLVIGFIIGIIICYQILFNEITDYMPQYATLKAMGFSNRYLMGVVVQEAALLSIFGFLPGLAGSAAFYRIMQEHTRIIMMITPLRVAVIFVLTFFMCIVAGLIVMKKIIKTDPAELF